MLPDPYGYHSSWSSTYLENMIIPLESDGRRLSCLKPPSSYGLKCCSRQCYSDSVCSRLRHSRGYLRTLGYPVSVNHRSTPDVWNGMGQELHACHSTLYALPKTSSPRLYVPLAHVRSIAPSSRPSPCRPSCRRDSSPPRISSHPASLFSCTWASGRSRLCRLPSCHSPM